MEHRNSTFLVSPSPLSGNRSAHLASVSHEFCHAWNVERIRPASLEPFNFEDANVSGELWMAEGFCNYYGSLVLRRSGLMSVRDYARDITDALSTVITAPGRKSRSVIEMSQLAPLVDGAGIVDRSVPSGSYVSYYTWGEALGVGLDLMLRDRSDGRVTLDDYMRALWQRFGRSAARRTGYVDSPYTLADLKSVLAPWRRRGNCRGLLARYIHGPEVDEFERSRKCGLGDWARGDRPGVPGRDAPADGERPERRALHQRRAVQVAGLWRRPRARRCHRVARQLARGERGRDRSRADDAQAGRFAAGRLQRRGERITALLKLVEDPTLELVPAEEAGQALSDAQKKFRDAWLSSAARAF